MVDVNYHKGQKCVYGSTFCQEGFCSACNIHLSIADTILGTSLTTQRINPAKRNNVFPRIGSLQPI
jgi:hypothetical protein